MDPARTRGSVLGVIGLETGNVPHLRGRNIESREIDRSPHIEHTAESGVGTSATAVTMRHLVVFVWGEWSNSDTPGVVWGTRVLWSAQELRKGETKP